MPKPGTREGDRERAANCERRLVFRLSLDKETIPAKLIPDTALVYKILQKKLAVETNSKQSTITAIFATDPSNPQSWSMTFDSTATKQIYETRDTTFANRFEGVIYMYRLRAKRAAKQLLVTIQSSPLITDGELAFYLRRFVVVKKVFGQSFPLNHQIDSGLKCIILLMNDDGETRDIRGFMITPDGTRRKLFFQGNIF